MATPTIHAQTTQSSFQCTAFKTPNSCAVTRCEGTISGYTQPVSIFIPKRVQRVSVFFHGFILGTTQSIPYENPDTAKMLEAFGVIESLCKANHALIVPRSLGSNTDYNKYFVDSAHFDTFMNLLFAAKTTGVNTNLNSLNRLPITLKAHSGGGLSVSLILNKTKYLPKGTPSQRVSQVSLFDGIYNVVSPPYYEAWFNQNTGVQIKMAALCHAPGITETWSPCIYSNTIFNAVVNKRWYKTGTNISLSGKPYTIQSFRFKTNAAERATRQSTDAMEPIDHYHCLSETWDRML